jgi:hypothetical protein
MSTHILVNGNEIILININIRSLRQITVRTYPIDRNTASAAS